MSTTAPHTVEKIGGTSMSRFNEIKETIFLGNRSSDEIYNRIFVVSAYGGMTNMLLEHKKTKEPGVYKLFCREQSWAWSDALSDVLEKMCAINSGLFTDEGDRVAADQFVTERVEGVRSCLMDLQRLCSFGHFQLHEHLQSVREMLSALGEAHSANNLCLLLRQEGINTRFIDLSGWRGEETLPLDEKIKRTFQEVDVSNEMPIVTGYTHCEESLMGTYDRGYTEITFSKIAVLTNASEAIIHKEFHLCSADPNLVENGEVLPIGRTNYDVADQLSDMGMEAIHPGAAKGLRQAGIPLRIRHSFEPDHPGTVITSGYKCEVAAPEIIAGQPSITAVTVHDQDMVGHADADARLTQIISKQGLRYMAKDTNANTITHYFHAPLGQIDLLVESLKYSFKQADIDVKRLAVVSVIGSNMSVPGILAKACGILSDNDINVLAVHQNMRQVDLRFIVEQKDYAATVDHLHHGLIESVLPDAVKDDHQDLAAMLTTA